MLTVVTLGLLAIAGPFILQYLRLGLPWMAAFVGAAVVVGSINLVWARSKGQAVAGGLIGAALMFLLLLASNVVSGGFYDSNMGWLYVIPVLAALLVDSRAGAMFTVLVLIAIVGFWISDVVGWPRIPSRIPTEEHALQSLANRMSAVVAIGVVLAALASRDRSRQRVVESANQQLKAELVERERIHRELARARRLAMIGELAAGVGHELNNPLTYLITNLELLEEALPETLVDSRILVAEGLDGARRVRDIVGNLRALSRDPEPEEVGPVSISKVIERALQMVPDLPARVEVDPEQAVAGHEGPIVQIMVNLLNNASRALLGVAEPDVWIRVRTRGGRVAIDVVDNGPGVPAEIREQIFEPMFTTNQGTGLGLSICRSLATRMGGSLELVTSEGTGATFRLMLAEAEAISAAGEVEPVGTSHRVRLLVVDDDPLVLRALGRALSEHDVVLASGPDAALAAWESGPFDCVLCDVMMPGTTGPDLVAALEARQEGVSRRVVYMTGAILNETDPEALRGGAVTLVKPLDLAQLRRTVVEVARRHEI